MIRRSDYTDREWAEVLARCEILDFQPTFGTPIYIKPDDKVGILLDPNQSPRADYSLWVRGSGYGQIWRPIRKCVVLTRLDQLVRMDGWVRNSCYMIKPGETPYWDNDSPIELAALRALQRCDEDCGEEECLLTLWKHKPLPTKEKCAGIHPPHIASLVGPHHKCLEHALEIDLEPLYRSGRDKGYPGYAGEPM